MSKRHLLFCGILFGLSLRAISQCTVAIPGDAHIHNLPIEYINNGQDAQRVIGDNWICAGDTLWMNYGLGSQTFYLEENAYLHGGGGGSRVVYLKQGAKFDAGGGGSQVITYDTLTAYFNVGGSNVLTSCRPLIYTYASAPAGGCQAVTPLNAKFNVNTNSICAGDTVIFTDQSTGSPTQWRWAFSGGSPATSAAQNPLVVYDSSGTFNVKLEISNTTGADSLTDTGYITVQPLPVTGKVTGPAAICAGDSVQLNNTGSAGAIQWQSSVDGTSFTDMAADTSPVTRITGINETMYYRVEVSNTCGTDSSLAFKLSVNLLPVPVLTTGDSLLCSGDSAKICTTNPFTMYRWNTSDTLACITATAAGDYWVTVTDSNQCSAVSGHQQISVYPVPSVSITRQGDTLSSFGQVSYQWIRNNVPIDSATGSFYVAHQSGLYAVQVTDSNGCTTTSEALSVTVGISDLMEQNISIYPNPSVGSWQLTVGNELVGSALEIYDEQGRLVFHSKLSTQNSKLEPEVPSGVYYLRISNDKVSVVRKLVKL